MKKLVVWSLFILSMGICGCLKDTVVITEPEENISQTGTGTGVPIDERCSEDFQGCERYYNNLNIGGAWTVFYYENAPSDFISEFIDINGEIVNLLDPCIDTICNIFNLELKSDTTFTMDWNVITASESEPVETYQKSLSGEYYICWCFRLSGGNHPGWWHGEITFLTTDGAELTAEFERSLAGNPMKFDMETNEGEFKLMLQK